VSTDIPLRTARWRSVDLLRHSQLGAGALVAAVAAGALTRGFSSQCRPLVLMKVADGSREAPRRPSRQRQVSPAPLLAPELLP